jgi:ribonuclease VapC
LDALVANFRLRMEPVTEEQVRIARQAYLDFGRGNHPAALNFGDCFAYALAKTTGEPLLFKGDDFVHTDVTPAAPP